MFFVYKAENAASELKTWSKEFAAMIIEHVNLPTVNDVLQHAV